MMNFLAMMLALGLERVFSQFVHLRDVSALDAYARHVVRRVAAGDARWRLLKAWAYALVPALVVLLVAATGLHGIAYVAYATLAVAFALGPEDLFAEVAQYVAAMREASPAAAVHAAELLEHDAGQRSGPALDRVADAVFVQANNRLFGVLFWFALLGPAGPAAAVLFRVTDVLRRAALREAQARGVVTGDPAVAALQCVHGALAWAPARLLAFSYGVAGSFDDAFRGWRGYLSQERDEFFEANDRLLVHAGQGAMGASFASSTDEVACTELALALVRRSLYVWVAAIAALAVVSGAA